MRYTYIPGLHRPTLPQQRLLLVLLVYSTPTRIFPFDILPLLQKLYEQTGVVVTEISLPAHPHAAYISLTLKYF
jgi:hypothetical protein